MIPLDVIIRNTRLRASLDLPERSFTWQDLNELTETLFQQRDCIVNEDWQIVDYELEPSYQDKPALPVFNYK